MSPAGAISEAIDPEEHLLGTWISTFDPRGLKLLFAAVVRQAARDFVFEYGHRRLAKRRRGLEAYYWLFREKPPPWLDDREATDPMTEPTVLRLRIFMSFGSVCEILGEDPGYWRKYIRGLTPEDFKKIERNSL